MEDHLGVFASLLLVDLPATTVGVFRCGRLESGRCSLINENGVPQCGRCPELFEDWHTFLPRKRENSQGWKEVIRRIMSNNWGSERAMNSSWAAWGDTSIFSVWKGDIPVIRVRARRGKIIIAGADVEMD